MKSVFRHVCLLVAVLGGLRLEAARKIGFGADAFNGVVPVKSTKSEIFSPVSFEIDCAVVAESLETIPKAGVSETMGVVIDFAGMYAPLVESLATRTNGLAVTTARGFCVPDLKLAQPTFRQYLQRTYGTEVMRLLPARGAETWFRAAMDGAMEDFALPAEVVRSERFSYYDLVSISVAWREPFPTNNTRRIKFQSSPDRPPKSVLCMSDVRLADTYETKEYVLLRLPLKADAWFYAILPKAGFGLKEVRADFSSLEVSNLLTVMKSVSDPGVAHGPCAIILPRFEMYSRHDFAPAMTMFKIPGAGLVHVAGDRSASAFEQWTKFRLLEYGEGENPLAQKPAEEVVALTPGVKKLVFNRPFFFFVYQESTQSFLVAGQYCGEE